MFTLASESLKGYGLNRIFAFAKEAGFDGIDIALDKEKYDSLNADYLHELQETFKLPITALETAGNASYKDIMNSINLAKELGIKIVIVQPPKIIEFRKIKWMKFEIPKIRKRENLSIALENAPSKKYFGFIPERAMNNLNELKRFKHACLDVSRLAEKREDLIHAYGLLKNYIVHIHISNVYRRNAYALPMKGILPLESFLAKLKSTDYKGAISLKVKPEYLEAGNDKAVLKNLKECLAFFDKYFKKS